MRKIDFTIAVAIYNVENYLRECLDSILVQLDDSMQLILVDDGSFDSCGKICDFYAQKDDRVEVIHQKNGGLSAARNTAIEHAHGKWIVFVDGDDRLAENAMEYMKKYSEDDAQLVIFDYTEFDNNGQLTRHHAHTACIFDTHESLEQFRAATLYLPSTLNEKFAGGTLITSWGKMWRLSYIKEYGYHFNTAVRRGEDNAFSFAASRNMNRVCVSDACVYAYRWNNTGIMHRFEPKTLEHYRILSSAISKDMIEHREEDNLLLRNAFCELCADGLCYSLMQTLLHRDCHWKRKDRIAWLKALAHEDWVKEAEKHTCISKPKRMILHLMKNKSYRIIDLCCTLLRSLELS